MDKVSRDYQRSLDGRLWMWILNYGGLHRDRERWDSRLTVGENRRMFRFLDRAGDQGHHLDRLGKEIACVFPEYGIENSDDLWSWLQRSQA